MLFFREAPCQTKTLSPSVCAAISLRHCMTATVGLDDDGMSQRIN